MSDVNTQGQPEVSGGTGDVAQDTDQGSDGGSEYSLASPFLEKVPAEHRTILEPYVKQWDAGVSRRFQELHGKFKPYEELGADPEVLSQAYQIYQMLDTNPKQLYDLLAEDFAGEAEPTSPAESQTEPGDAPGIPQEWEQKFTKQQEILEALVEHVMSERTTQQESQEDQEFEEYLGMIKQEAGEDSQEFEDFILAQLIANDGDANAALQTWNSFKQSLMNSAAKPTPPVLSGGGSVPQESQSIKDLSKKDTVSFVADLLSNVNRE